VLQDNGRQCNMVFNNGHSFLLPPKGRKGQPTPRVDHVASTIDNWDLNRVETEFIIRHRNNRAWPPRVPVSDLARPRIVDRRVVI
jgi:hypothetical protein